MVWRSSPLAIGIAGVLLGIGIGFLIGRGSAPTRESTRNEIAAGKTQSVLSLQRRAGGRDDASPRDRLVEPTTFAAEFLADFPKPSLRDLEAFLESRGRDAESLVTAYLSGWHDEHLIEAARQYPDDPLVQWTVLSLGFHETLGDEAADWAERFQSSEPDNPMAYYFSALAKLERDPDEALSELEHAMGVHGGTDFFGQVWVAKSALYESMGAPSWKAEAFATASRGSPQWSRLRNLANGIVALAEERREAGDDETADRAASALLEMGRQIEDEPMLIDRLVGMAIQEKALAVLDPDGTYPFMEGSVDEYRSNLEKGKAGFRSVGKLHTEFWGAEQTTAFGERDWREYLRRVRIQGEVPALEWLQSRAKR